MSTIGAEASVNSRHWGDWRLEDLVEAVHRVAALLPASLRSSRLTVELQNGREFPAVHVRVNDLAAFDEVREAMLDILALDLFQGDLLDRSFTVEVDHLHVHVHCASEAR